VESYRIYSLHSREGVDDHIILGPVNLCQWDICGIPRGIPRCSHKSSWFQRRCAWKSLYRAGQSRLSCPHQMSGNEDAKTQEHRKQVGVRGVDFTGAYNEGVLYQS
jgi:hypothetical protein